MNKRRKQIRVLIADDHPLIRDRLKSIVRMALDLTVAGEAQTSEAVFQQAARDHLDVVVLDVSFPDRSGIEILKDLKREHPQLPVLMVSMYKDELVESSAFQAGASGYLTKDRAAKELVAAIRTVVGGGTYQTGRPRIA